MKKIEVNAIDLDNIEFELEDLVELIKSAVLEGEEILQISTRVAIKIIKKSPSGWSYYPEELLADLRCKIKEEA